VENRERKFDNYYKISTTQMIPSWKEDVVRLLSVAVAVAVAKSTARITHGHVRTYLGVTAQQVSSRKPYSIVKRYVHRSSMRLNSEDASSRQITAPGHSLGSLSHTGKEQDAGMVLGGRGLVEEKKK
jgi:hypothetical protein